MANKPTRELRVCVFGNQLHEAAGVAQGGRFYDPIGCVVEVEGLQLQGLFKVRAARVPGVGFDKAVNGVNGEKAELETKKLNELLS